MKPSAIGLRVLAVIGLTGAVTLTQAAPGAFAAGTVGTGTPASCTESALVSALTGGGLVTFNCGGPATIKLTTEKNINQDTVIQGGGVITLTGGLTTGLFNVVAPASLSLSDITLDSAKSNHDGGAIISTGTMTLTNVIFQNNQTPGCGGAFWSNGTITVNGGSFNNNTAGSGGAICTGVAGTTRLLVNRSDFNDNKATSTTTGYGGAIHVNGAVADVTIVDAYFIGNTAKLGGALNVFRDEVAKVITQDPTHHPVFVTNSASSMGGGVYVLGRLTMIGAELNANTATDPVNGYGGGIADLGYMNLQSTLLSVNSARNGGGIFVGGADKAAADIDKVRLSHNSAGLIGGGMYAQTDQPADTSVITMTNSVIDHNTSGAVGGGIGRFNARLDITNSSFTDNSAALGGGGLYVSGGGVPSGDPSFVSVTSSSFISNTTTSGHGGGIQNGGDFLSPGYNVFKNLTIKGNTNGIYDTGLTIHLGNSVLDGNSNSNCQFVSGASLSSDGHNFSTDASCGLSTTGDREGAGLDAKLGPRAVNTNGVNETLYSMPLDGSPLINAGASCPTLDQRGAARPGTCDIGAVAYQGLAFRVFTPIVNSAQFVMSVPGGK